MKTEHNNNGADKVIGTISLILLCVIAASGCIAFFGNGEYFTALVCYFIFHMIFKIIKYVIE